MTRIIGWLILALAFFIVPSQVEPTLENTVGWVGVAIVGAILAK